ncbi:MAG: hypothetical protein JWP87_5448 [Labilithrix sp.]|nr:hypothetical protein [Labilithrix sp.]
MNRRAFLRDATRMVLVLPFGTFLVQCSNDDNSGTASSTNPTVPGSDTTPPDAPPHVDGANIVYTSSQTNAHSHSFSVPSASIESPPPTGVVGATTEAQLHSHNVNVTSTNLEDVKAGKAVKVLTTETAGHRHTFTFVKIA